MRVLMNCQLDGFDWIFQGLKGQKKIKFSYFATFWQFYQKGSDNFSLLLSKDGCDWIIQKVIFNVRKDKFSIIIDIIQ